MRLTLRTMLAYLGNILDEDQAQELGERIEKSDFASGLVHRIRSVTRRLRLGVPTLEGRGMGLDPNTVSEYLEDALPAERVPEIEKICLESDVHLAEVASCHQILILVESEPAEVGPDLKDRIYRIGAPKTTRRASRAPAGAGLATSAGEGGTDGEYLEAPPVAGGEPMAPPATSPLPPAAATTQATGRKSREVPDYLRIGQHSRWKPLAITLVLAFVVSGVALRAMGPFDGSHPLLRLLGVSEPAEEVAQAPSSRVGTQDGDDQVAPAPIDEPTGPSSNSDAGPVDAVPPTSPPADSTDQAPASSDTVDTTVSPVAPAPSESGANQPTPDAGSDQPVESAAPADELEFPTTSPVVDSADGSTGPMDVAEPEQPTDVASAPVQPAPQPSVEIGYVKLTDTDFLVRFDAQAGEWYRLPARTILMSEDQLAVFPTYHPEIVLTSGVQVAFAGASKVRTLPPGQQGEPSLVIDYGRVLIATAGVAGARIHLELAGRGGTATFADAASEIGIEVLPYLAPGADPEVEAAIPVVRIYTTIGAIDWQPDGVDVGVEISSGNARVLIGDQAQTAAVEQSPPWIHGAVPDGMERLAREGLEPSIIPDRSVILSLEEQSQGRRLEVRSLAARCLAYLESYEALVQEFSDDRQKSVWSTEFDVLRDSIARSPQSAAGVRDALDRYCGDAATDLYRLLWGYNPQQLQGGGDRKLVDFLEHPSLNVRVFAYENLRRITDKTFGYRPELTAERRKGSVQDWRESLENGAIVYDTPPSAAIIDGE